jgi:hypothetical protein
MAARLIKIGRRLARIGKRLITDKDGAPCCCGCFHAYLACDESETIYVACDALCKDGSPPSTVIHEGKCYTKLDDTPVIPPKGARVLDGVVTCAADCNDPLCKQCYAECPPCDGQGIDVPVYVPCKFLFLLGKNQNEPDCRIFAHGGFCYVLSVYNEIVNHPDGVRVDHPELGIFEHCCHCFGATGSNVNECETSGNCNFNAFAFLLGLPEATETCCCADRLKSVFAFGYYNTYSENTRSNIPPCQGKTLLSWTKATETWFGSATIDQPGIITNIGTFEQYIEQCDDDVIHNVSPTDIDEYLCETPDVCCPDAKCITHVLGNPFTDDINPFQVYPPEPLNCTFIHVYSPVFIGRCSFQLSSLVFRCRRPNPFGVGGDYLDEQRQILVVMFGNDEVCSALGGCADEPKGGGGGGANEPPNARQILDAIFGGGG